MRLLQSDGVRLLAGSRQSPIGAVKINWSLAPRGLVTFFLNNTQPIKDLVKNQTALTQSAAAPRLTMSQAGPLYDPFSGTTNAYVRVPNPPATNQCSMECYIYFDAQSIATTVCQLAQTLPNDATNDRRLQVDALNRPLWSIFDGATRTATGSALTTGMRHFVGTSDGSTIRLYVDGVEVANFNPTSNGGYSGYTAAIFVEGTTGQTSVYPIAHTAYADVAWTADEAKSRFLNMYDFIVPVEGEMPALYVAPAPPVVSSRQYIVGPGVYVSETGTRSYMLAPGVYVTETVSAVTAPATQYAAFSLPQHSLSQVIQKMVGY